MINKDSRYELAATYGYNEWAQLASEEYPGQAITNNTWDNYGRITQVATGIMNTRYTYNIHGATSVTSPNGLTRHTEYNAFGEPYLIRDEEGNIIEKHDYIYSINP